MRIPYTIMIDRPGQYLTRGGKTVRIDSVSTNEAAGSFPCKGRIQKIDSIGRVRWEYSVWALDGRYKALAGSKRDIVAYVGA